MLDVHAPHQRMEGFKDFLLHLFTITVGLLIALSLEGCVEWRQHHRLANEAKAALTHEITQNQKTLSSLRQPIKDQQKQLDDDLTALQHMRAHPTDNNQTVAFGFAMHSFDSVAWKTAQSTGALAYMPYGDASRYADLYDGQEQLVEAERQVVEGVLNCAAVPSAYPPDWKPTPSQIDDLTRQIGLLRMRLYFLTSLMDSLDKNYLSYESDHPTP